MPKKLIEIESSLKATENLRPYFDEQKKLQASDFPRTVAKESAHLTFLEPLWGMTPQYVHAQNGEFVVGNIYEPKNTGEKLYESSRAGVWNAAIGELVFKRLGAVSICWSPDYSQIGVWSEQFNGDPNNKVKGRSDWDWTFERYDWKTKSLISSCKIDNGGYFWSIYAEFPKKYKGVIARLYVGCEEGRESLFVLCDDKNGDRELLSEEIKPFQKLKKFDVNSFWEALKNPIPTDSKPAQIKPSQLEKEPKEYVVSQIKKPEGFNELNLLNLGMMFKFLPLVVDCIIKYNWCIPSMEIEKERKAIFDWQNPDSKVDVKVIFRKTVADIEIKEKHTGKSGKVEWAKVWYEKFTEDNLVKRIEQTNEPINRLGKG